MYNSHLELAQHYISRIEFSFEDSLGYKEEESKYKNEIYIYIFNLIYILINEIFLKEQKPHYLLVLESLFKGLRVHGSFNEAEEDLRCQIICKYIRSVLLGFKSYC